MRKAIQPIKENCHDRKFTTRAGMKNLVRIDQGQVRNHLDVLIRTTVEQMLNDFLDAEANQIFRAQRYERSADRVDTRAGSYTRKYLDMGKINETDKEQAA